MLRPPCRTKISVNSTSSAPVTISVTVPAVDSAPLVNLSWLFCSASMADLRAWSICSRADVQAARSVSQLPTPSMLCGHLLDESRRTLDELGDDEREDARRRTAKPPSSTSATAPPRGAPRRSRKSTAGSSNAARIVASATGTTINSSRLTSQSTATSPGEDHQQPPRPCGRLTDQRAHRLIGDRVDRRARRHAGSVAVAAPTPSICGFGAGTLYPVRRVPRRARQRRAAARSGPPGASTGGCAGRSSPSRWWC